MVVLVIVALVLTYSFVIKPQNEYNKALRYYSIDDMDVYAFLYLSKSACENLANDTQNTINMLKSIADRVQRN